MRETLELEFMTYSRLGVVSGRRRKGQWYGMLEEGMNLDEEPDELLFRDEERSSSS